MSLPIVLTMGDPAGIGGEISLAAWQNRQVDALPPFLILDEPERLARTAQALGLDVPIVAIKQASEAVRAFEKGLPVMGLPLAEPPVPGKPSLANAGAVIRSIRDAVRLVQSGEAAAVVTNPIAKSVLYGAGFGHPGHTEYLAELAGGMMPVMMLAIPGLRVVPVTIHVGLLDAIRTLTSDQIVETARITASGLRRDFGIVAPRLAIAGLNPHAGEDGAMGREDIEIVKPAVDRLRALGIDAMGPLPPDTMFHAAARRDYDAAICMYHDQALIPLKTLDFEHGVNVTLGLPFIRTSPDHGTAFDIAGQGKASAASLTAAIRMAGEMAAARNLLQHK